MIVDEGGKPLTGKFSRLYRTVGIDPNNSGKAFASCIIGLALIAAPITNANGRESLRTHI